MGSCISTDALPIIYRGGIESLKFSELCNRRPLEYDVTFNFKDGTCITSPPIAKNGRNIARRYRNFLVRGDISHLNKCYEKLHVGLFHRSRSLKMKNKPYINKVYYIIETQRFSLEYVCERN